MISLTSWILPLTPPSWDEMIRKLIIQIQDFFSGKTTFKKFIPGIAWFFILLFLLCIPARDLPKSDDWMEKIFFDKWIHAGLFGLLAFLFMAPVYSSSLSAVTKGFFIMIIVALVSAWGLITEFIQHYLINGRAFDKYDWLADTAGAILAILVTKYLLQLKVISLK